MPGAGIGGLRAADGTFATGAPSGTAEVLSQVGGNQPHDNMPPFAALHAVIALDGVFPPRK